jgi:hypothetical protein
VEVGIVCAGEAVVVRHAGKAGDGAGKTTSGIGVVLCRTV